MGGNISPLTIDIAPHAGGGYKSITTLSWVDIPALAILTGKNGSGKTQLLELLAYHFSGARPPGLPSPPAMPVEIRVSGSTYKPEEIAFVPSGGRFSGGTAASLANVKQFYAQALQRAKQMGGSHHDIQAIISARRISSRLGGRNLHGITPEEFEELSSDADFMADDIDITASLSRVFVAHRFKIVEALERETPGVDEKGNPLGPAPWDVVNEALSCSPLQVAGAKIRCLSCKLVSVAAAGKGRRHNHETTVDHALMRGLATAGPVMRRGASSV
jgi:energy-coupling factor transporter ATP-binding protein EcfA2